MDAQLQPYFSWPTSFDVARAFVDQLVRADAVTEAQETRLRNELPAAERGGASERDVNALDASADMLEADALASLVGGDTGNDNRIRALLAAES